MDRSRMPTLCGGVGGGAGSKIEVTLGGSSGMICVVGSELYFAADYWKTS